MNPSIPTPPLPTTFSLEREEDLVQVSRLLAHTERLATLGTLTASVAHELNNPLSVIITTCHALLHQSRDGTLTLEQGEHLARVIEENAWRCAQHVQRLRDYGRRQAPALERLDPNELVREAVALVRYELDVQAIRLCLSLEQDLPPVFWDRNQLLQVLVNMLLNARDAVADSGSEISVASWVEPDAAHVGFSVSDDGEGIPEALRARIFEPFFTTKPVDQGTGLGLSIAAGIVAAHGGRITTDENEHGGATFEVVLPCHPESFAT